MAVDAGTVVPRRLATQRLSARPLSCGRSWRTRNFACGLSLTCQPSACVPAYNDLDVDLLHALRAARHGRTTTRSNARWFHEQVLGERMFLALILLISIALSLAAAVLIDNTYQAIVDGRWRAVSVVVAIVAAAAGALYGAPMG